MPQKLSNLPNRALIKFGKHQINSEAVQPIIWMVADKNHSGYPSNSVTLITEKIIDLRAYDAKDHGATYGTADYTLSNIHRWLTSEASAGQWYTAAHANDKPPSGNYVTGNPYEARPGFLYNFTEAERTAMLPTTLKVQTSETTFTNITTKIFLPSVREILGTSAYADDSSRFSSFATGEVRGTLTAQAYNNVSERLNIPSKITDYWHYLTRNVTSNSAKAIHGTDGSASETSFYLGHMGVRPVINLSSNTKISDTTDADGCYTVLPQTAPVIGGSNTNLGTKSEGFSHSYSVNDADTDDSVVVTEYIDNVTIRSYVATKNAQNTFAVTGNTWLKLANGIHTLKITATDGIDTATRTITFTKSVTKLVAQRTTPIEASTMPTRIIVTLVKNVPYNSNVKVEVCNNGFDPNPAWEEIDTYESGLAHTFANRVCESTIQGARRWGVNIRVTVERGQGEGACYISEIGGNFE